VDMVAPGVCITVAGLGGVMGVMGFIGATRSGPCGGAMKPSGIRETSVVPCDAVRCSTVLTGDTSREDLGVRVRPEFSSCNGVPWPAKIPDNVIGAIPHRGGGAAKDASAARLFLGELLREQDLNSAGLLMRGGLEHKCPPSPCITILANGECSGVGDADGSADKEPCGDTMDTNEGDRT